MTRNILIERTLDNLEKLPDDKLQEVFNFTEFLLTKIESDPINEGIQKLVQEGDAYQFLHDEEDLYTLKDLKEIYN